MWKLYDDLYIGIPSGIRITDCIIGEMWTCVSANGNTGIARTMGLPENPYEYQSGFVGEYLRETGNHMKWDSLYRASIGVAALNAWYNTQERAEALDGGGDAVRLPTKTAHVGDSYGSGYGVFPLPQAQDFDEAIYTGLRSFEVVVVSADALATKALPGLLRIVGESGNVILEGHSLPCSALFFAFDMPIRELRGFFAQPADTLIACAQDSAKDPAPGMLPFVIRPQK